MERRPFIEFSHVSKTYKGNFLALNDVSFNIKKSEIFGYIGPNGAGKTTTIKIIVGLIKDFQGDVIVDGQQLNGYKDFHKILGYLPQEVGFQEWRTVNHALVTFGLLSGIARSQINERIDAILDLVNLHDVRYKKIVHLSGGMVQKLRLAQALLHDPEIVILDEPMNGLDPASRFQVKNIIKSLARRGKTVLFSSHILSDVQDIADTIGILNRGQLARIGTPTQLQEEFQVGNVVEVELGNGEMPSTVIAAVPAIEKIEPGDNHKYLVHIKVDADVDATIASLLRVLLDARAKIRSFSLARPSLEDVYLKLVGGAPA